MLSKTSLIAYLLLIASGLLAFAKPESLVLSPSKQSPTSFSLVSVKNDWQTREIVQDWKPLQYFLTRTQNGIESSIELAQPPSDWEIINEQQILLLYGASDLVILDFAQPNTTQNVDLDVGSVDILEIATFEGGFYFVSAEAEQLALSTDALWRYEWEKGDYTSVAIPDSLNMSGLTASRDGRQLAFEHSISSNEEAVEEVYQLIYFDLASQNARILDQGSQSKAERFVKDRTNTAFHFQGEQNLVYLKSSRGEMNVYQLDLKNHAKQLVSSLPAYVSSINLASPDSFSYRSKDNFIMIRNWVSGNFNKQAIPSATSVLGLRSY